MHVGWDLKCNCAAILWVSFGNVSISPEAMKLQSSHCLLRHRLFSTPENTLINSSKVERSGWLHYKDKKLYLCV